MNARTLLLALLVFPIAALLADAQPRRIPTSKVPSFLFADPSTGRIHALTAGSDLNFNGLFEPDSGDVAPRWFVIDAATEQVVNSIAFDGFFSSFPLRSGVDLAGRLLYIAQLDRIRAYNIDSLKLVSDTVAPGDYSGVSYDSIQKRVILSRRPGFTVPGTIVLRDPAKPDTLAEVMVGPNPLMTVSQPSQIPGVAEYYTLSEGLFGSPTALLSYTLAQVEIYQKMNGSALAGGASYLAVNGNLAAIACGGGHKVYVIDTRTHRDLPYSPISFGPVGQNGPRTLAFEGDSILLIGTYSGEIFRTRLADGVITDTIKLRGKVESIALRDSLAYVALRFTYPVVTNDSIVVVVNLKSRAMVDTLVAGREPAGAFVAKNGDIHVIGMGINDSARWWTVFDGATHEQKSTRTFIGRLDNPFRMVYDSATDTLYAVISDTLHAFSVASAGVDSRPVYVPAKPYGKLIGVSDGGEYLLAIESTRSGEGSEYLHVIDRNGELFAKFKTGARPIMAARIGASHDSAVGIYLLNRAAPGRQASGLDLYEFQTNVLGSDTLGRGANHITLGGGGAGITMNAGHQFVMVNLSNWSVTNRLSTRTTGFDGPREALFLPDGRVILTTYEGNLLAMNASGGYQAYPIGGKGEGLATLAGKVFAASAFTANYAPDTSVVVYDAASLLASVERELATASGVSLEQNYPNPATSSTSIRFAIERPTHVTVALFNAAGELVQNVIDEEMESGSYVATLDLSGLPSGSYIYALHCDGRLLTKTMRVVR